ncbi:MAG: malic enzyme [Alphaproteobacteria bacterium]|nr:malic enzyme [Alphaproteobacteria bacterium]
MTDKPRPDNFRPDNFRQEALDYHQYPIPGKLTIVPTKDMATQRDLALAYSPGVAVPCEEIAANPDKVFDYTARGNLIAVISNGTAVLGLGNIGALASKPVMEGKAVLFKKFAGIDSIDLEITPTNVDEVVAVISALEPSFGGINLEDFKAPECFEIERRLKAKMSIPVFHDDQHGTAIVVAAAMLNWAKVTQRDLSDVAIVASGAGAASLACLDMLCTIGVKKENILVTDKEGVVYTGRNEGMDEYKARYAAQTSARNLSDAMATGPDVFLGLSAAGVLKPEMLHRMKDKPLILALANPVPEIMPDLVTAVRPDAMIATGRSDFPNQVNNVLCFPFIFRGALDAGATEINEQMKKACAMALAELARQETTDLVSEAYGNKTLVFGPDYLIPKPFDPRLMVLVPMAVAKAAMESGVAKRPIADWKSYEQRLSAFTNRTSLVMRPVIEMAQQRLKKVIYAEGEEYNVLHAAQTIVDDRLAMPILVGRRSVVHSRIAKLTLRLEEGRDYLLVDPESDERYHDYSHSYHEIMARCGVTPADARKIMHTNTTVIGSMLLHKGEGDALICGVVGKYHFHLQHVRDIIGLRPGITMPAAMVMLMLPNGNYFICDTHVNASPNAQNIAEMTVLAAEQVRRFGTEPKIALLSHSNFGSHQNESATKMRDALAILRRLAPDLEVDGEMHGDAAINPEIRDIIFPGAKLRGSANLLVMPCLDSANIAFNLLKTIEEGVSVGPMLLGMKKPVHIVTPSIRPRGLVDITAHAAATAEERRLGKMDDGLPHGV